MRIKYYETVWRDIKNSPGWFGKLCLLALVNFIPVFGQIVTFGYLYGWAREIAWGVHAPMPAKIICNEDGKFWRRGWFVLVITFVFALVPAIVMSIGQAMQGTGLGATASARVPIDAAMAGFGMLVYLVGAVFACFTSILAWIGSMRTSIYDRLSAGFQLGKIWKMFRRDTGGILRIFGMELLFSVILGIILSIVISILLFIVIFVGVAGLIGAGYSPDSLTHMTTAQATQVTIRFFAAAGIVGIVCLIAICFACFMLTSFIYLLVFRAVGYWTGQFDVPRWRGQDDPMPFEAAPAAAYPAQQAQPAQYYYGAPGQMQDPAQVQPQPQAGAQLQPQPVVPGQSQEQPQEQPQPQPQLQAQPEPWEQPGSTPQAQADFVADAADAILAEGQQASEQMGDDDGSL